MLIRIITAVVGFIVILPAFIFSDTVLLNIFIALLGIVSVDELLKCIGYPKKNAVAISAFLVSVIIPFATRSSSFLNNTAINNVSVCVSIAFVFMLIAFTCAVFSKGKCDIEKTSFFVLLCVYIFSGLSSIIIMRDMPGGALFYPLIFVTAWGTDIFAYFTGFFFGKHKLIPDVSPKKTVEGAVGGVVGTLICFVVYSLIFLELEVAQYIILFVFASFASVVSQIGDLLMSLIKRRYKIKDFGKLLPGHGGVLDRFDSTIAVSLFLCMLYGFINLI